MCSAEMPVTNIHQVLVLLTTVYDTVHADSKGLQGWQSGVPLG